jgi:hypothetical protein
LSLLCYSATMAEKETPRKQQAKDLSRKSPESGSVEGPPPTAPEEVGGRKGPEPTRYGDWEVKGICSDF